MRRAFAWLCTVFLLLQLPAGLWSAAAQQAYPAKAAEPGWDQLLDRYELICRNCVQLRNRKAQGEEISSRRLLALMDELESLRSELKGVSDKMPAAARRRFYAIRQMYATGVIADTRPAQLEPHSGIALPAAVTAGPPCPIDQAGPLPLAPRPWPSRLMVMPSVAAPELAFGVMGAYWGRRMGLWAAARSTFSRHKIAYHGRLDGSAGGARIWAGGQAATDRLFVSAGPLVRIEKNFALYGGAGYGFRQLCWADNNGAWIGIDDASGRGFCYELGVSLTTGSLALAVGFMSLPKTCSTATFSVGMTF